MLVNAYVLEDMEDSSTEFLTDLGVGLSVDVLGVLVQCIPDRVSMSSNIPSMLLTKDHPDVQISPHHDVSQYFHLPQLCKALGHVH